MHIVWTIYLFISTTLFWWWEFRLASESWGLTLYLVVIVYATLYFFASLVLQPGKLDAIGSYQEYFFAHRGWIFGLFICLIVWDFVDTLAKGIDHFNSFGFEYPIIYLSFVAASIVAIITPNKRYHEIFAPVWLVAYISYMYRVNYYIN